MKSLRVLLIIYIIDAFITAEFNPLEWSEEKRGGFIWEWVICVIIIIILESIKNLRKRKKLR